MARRNGKVFITGNSGFPKSHDVSKAIDKAAGAEREVVGVRAGHENFVGRDTHSLNNGWYRPWKSDPEAVARYHAATAPATPDALRWQGWGTALKPAYEPVIVARKPLVGTVAANVLKYGTGGMNIDGCRVATDESITNHSRSAEAAISKGKFGNSTAQETHQTAGQALGRWPANLIHDGSDEVTELFPQTGESKATPRNNGARKWFSKGADTPYVTYGHNDYGGSAARFFYCAKASKSDRDEGLEEMEERGTAFNDIGFDETKRNRQPRNNTARNFHPTVKPTALMRWLVRLVTPPGGVVLDPFMGSGSTGKAARLEGFSFIGIELDAEYLEIARRRIAAVEPEPVQDTLL